MILQSYTIQVQCQRKSSHSGCLGAQVESQVKVWEVAGQLDEGRVCAALSEVTRLASHSISALLETLHLD